MSYEMFGKALDRAESILMSMQVLTITAKRAGLGHIPLETKQKLSKLILNMATGLNEGLDG